MNANELKTGIEAIKGATWSGSQWYTLWLCGRKVGTIVCAGRAIAQLEGIARNQGLDLCAARAAYVAAVEVEAAQIVEKCAPATITRTVATARPTVASAQRCPFHKAVKRCYAIFADCGLSVEDDAMRETLSALLNKPVASRKVLSGADWMRAGDLAKWRVGA